MMVDRPKSGPIYSIIRWDLVFTKFVSCEKCGSTFFCELLKLEMSRKRNWPIYFIVVADQMLI